MEGFFYAYNLRYESSLGLKKSKQYRKEKGFTKCEAFNILF